MRSTILALTSFLLAPSANAEPLRVVADVAPIHSLVAQVMDGVGEPALLIPAQASPHGHALKPSQARLLSQADAVFWVGESLTPWLEQALETLGADAVKVELLDVETLTLLEVGDNHHDHSEGEHGHEDVDPHIWLDPHNARILISAIAETLAKQDAANALRYRENAKAAATRIDALSTDVAQIMAPAKGRQYIVVHDGYRYFEERFGLGRAIAISDSHAARPGARRISEVRDLMRNSDVRCVFDEVQLDAKAVNSIVRGTTARRATLDPMGSQVEPGPDLYEAVIRSQAQTMIECLK